MSLNFTDRYDVAEWALNSSSSPESGKLKLDSSDLDHAVRLFNKYNVKECTLKNFRISEIPERHHLFRYALKEADVLIAEGGFLELEFIPNEMHGGIIRSEAQIRHEVAVALDGRYSLIDRFEKKLKQPFFRLKNSEILTLKYQKKSIKSCPGDRITKWSFGIVTDGKAPERLKNLIQSIIDQNIPDYEILVCGPEFLSDEPDRNVSVLYDTKFKDVIGGPIGHKKNLLVDNMKNENIVLLHDRYSFPDGWFEKVVAYGNHFEILIHPTFTHGGGRLVDWAEYRGRIEAVSKLMPISGLVDYSCWSADWYAQGGVLIIKRSIYNRIRFDERLCWKELEDVHFSKLAHLKGFFCYLDPANYLWSEVTRLPASRSAKSGTFRKILRNALKISRCLPIYFKLFSRALSGAFKR